MEREALILISISAILLAIIAIVVMLVMQPSGEDHEQIACTMEARICPDGSAVGRAGPNCEFTPCPIETPPAVPAGCPEDTMVCPDGTVVVRVAPSCGFAPCPETPSAGITTDVITPPADETPLIELPAADAPAEEETDPCSIWNSSNKIAECYSLLAQENNDPETCEKITIKNYKEECYRGYASYAKDPSLCVKTGSAESDCFKKVNLQVMNYTYCLSIQKDTSERQLAYDGCLAGAAKNTLTDDPCRLISHFGRRSDCVEYVAFELGTLDGCLMLLEEDLWGPAIVCSGTEIDCFRAVVNDTRDISVCSNLDYGWNKNCCVYYGVTDLDLSSSRCAALDMDDEYLCRAIADNEKELCAQIRDEDEHDWCEGLWE